MSEMGQKRSFVTIRPSDRFFAKEIEAVGAAGHIDIIAIIAQHHAFTSAKPAGSLIDIVGLSKKVRVRMGSRRPSARTAALFTPQVSDACLHTRCRICCRRFPQNAANVTELRISERMCVSLVSHGTRATLCR